MPRPKDETYVIDLCDDALGMKALRGHTFDFLLGDPGKNGKKSQLPVDAYYPKLNLVVEYDERQHSSSVPFFDRRVVASGLTRGEQRKRYDSRRHKTLPKHGIRLVVFDYQDFAHGPNKRLRRVEADRAVIEGRLFPSLQAARSIMKRPDVSFSDMGKMVTPTKMAKAAGIDPKAFRAALRRSNPTWHEHHKSWQVSEGGPEHKAMQGVLKTLQPETKSEKAKKSRKPSKKTPSDIIGAPNVGALKRAGFVVIPRSELAHLRANLKSVFDMLSGEVPRKTKK